VSEPTAPLALRSGAEALADALPPLLAEAEHLAMNVHMGEHGRRRAGMGDLFWQYRPAQDHDALRGVDWRRSAKSDAAFVQEKEWQVAQSVTLWADPAASMRFASDAGLPTKAQRARVLALATGVLLLRAGERVGLTDMAPRAGRGQIARIAAQMAEDAAQDYGAPSAALMPAHSQALFVSDFLGEIDPVEAALLAAADKGVRGTLVQVLDPVEIEFPFSGRTVFHSSSGTIKHETLKAADLRARYAERLGERRDRLSALARLTGWQYLTHRTDHSAAEALLGIYAALDKAR